MIKIIGGAIVCLSTYMFGVKKAMLLEKRVEILNEFEKSFILLKGEIKYAQASLPEAVSSVSDRTVNVVRHFYENLFEELSKGSELEFKTIWYENVKKFFPEYLLNTEDIAVINQLGGQLGHLDLSMQIKAIELCLSRLKERQDDALKAIHEKSKLYKTVGLASGALITLVLI